MVSPNHPGGISLKVIVFNTSEENGSINLYRHLNSQIFVITSSEVSGELQDGVAILLLTTDQEPILTLINRRKVTTIGKVIL